MIKAKKYLRKTNFKEVPTNLLRSMNKIFINITVSAVYSLLQFHRLSMASTIERKI